VTREETRVPSPRSAAAAAVALAGAAAGVALARRRAAARGVDNPAPEPVVAPPPPLEARERTVTTEDGVALSVHEHGPEQPGVTVVLAHGYVQSSRLWNGQVRDLLAARPDAKVVTYDHRGHGRSGPSAREGATLEQLGRDLAAVLDAVAPTGPVVVGGHSMGGMTIMALAEQRPELVGDRIAGVAFVATSSGGLADVTWGMPAPVARLVKRALPALNERAVRAEQKGKPRRLSPLETRLIFGKGADPADVRETLEVMAGCSAETVAAFLATFSDHDGGQALKALDVPAVVLVGDADRLCPLEHSRAIADALPQAELAVYPGAGHMVQLERRREVSTRLADLVDRAVPRYSASASRSASRPTPFSRSSSPSA
jgi:pimeloyl-ACP methyl ester carboxylesterase